MPRGIEIEQFGVGARGSGLSRTAARVEGADHLRSLRDVIFEQPRVPEVVLVPLRPHDVRRVDPSLVASHEPVRVGFPFFGTTRTLVKPCLFFWLNPPWGGGTNETAEMRIGARW